MTAASPFPIVIRLAGEPQGKGRPRFVRKTGRTFTPEKTRSYETAMRLAAQDVMGDRPPVDCPVFVTMTATLPIPGSWSGKKRRAAVVGLVWPTVKPDCDNLAKTIDALNEIVFVDDKQVVALTVLKVYGEKPELRITVREAACQVREGAPPLSLSELAPNLFDVTGPLTQFGGADA